mmetsp:Transcript_24327/g.72209  ORF Transcript_24327/g.72209 Transcript_24327/m.72209 type:complete len:92 (+) Transcript_24327:1416-1691(+)
MPSLLMLGAALRLRSHLTSGAVSMACREVLGRLCRRVRVAGVPWVAARPWHGASDAPARTSKEAVEPQRLPLARQAPARPNKEAVEPPPLA